MRHPSCTLLSVPLLVPSLHEGERVSNTEPVAVAYYTDKAYYMILGWMFFLYIS